MASPTSTYRLQIRPEWQLSDAAEVADYLADLGVGAVYCSPLLESARGSEHGYDVVRHDRIDPARGGAAGWRRLVEAARVAGRQLVVDIVPNHAGVADAAENPSWWDVLKYGRESRYAHWYDIDRGGGRILLPVLGDNVDIDRELTVEDDELRYYEHRFPLAPGTGGGSPAEVHDRQHYELANFRRADREQNYRRFFAVTTLAGLRVEDHDVFDATHAEILRWVHDDGVEGLRVDHPDGLVDPGEYLQRLAEAAPTAWITVEKILEPGEELPDWPVAGTTGYDALAEVSPLFVDPAGEVAFDALYRELTGDHKDFADHVEAGKRYVTDTILHAELTRLARLAPNVMDAEAALQELVIAFPVYRSYLPEGAEHLARAIEIARQRRPDLTDTIGTLTSRLTDPADELCLRFQQVTGAVMAKGVEDTAYYRYNRFIALNEVGGDPARFGLSLDEFHQAQRRRQQRQPLGMTTLSTHDTKRGEDVRARLAVLSELPTEWADLAQLLMAGIDMPSAPFGYLMFQTFAGVGFIERDRMHGYAEKAMREAAEGTRWVDSDEQFETRVHDAVDTVYDDPRLRAAVQHFLDLIEPHARSNSLSQKLVQLTMPGVPDVYQGTELWEDSLVDPDNRRPVDFDERRAMLRGLDTPAIDDSGAAKLWVVTRALQLRAARPGSFATYQPLVATGPRADSAVAFDRGGAVTVVTRLPVSLERHGGWGGTSLDLPPGDYTDVLTGRPVTGQVNLADLLATYPVALLAKDFE